MAKKKADIVNEQEINREIVASYLNDKLSEEERHVLEEKMVEHILYTDAMDGLESIPPSAVAEDLSELDKHLSLKSKEPKVWLRYAAILGLFVFSSIIAYILWNNPVKEQHTIETAQREEQLENNVVPLDSAQIATHKSIAKEILQKPEAEVSKDLQQKRTSKVVQHEEGDHVNGASANAVMPENEDETEESMVQKPVNNDALLNVEAVDIEEPIQKPEPTAKTEQVAVTRAKKKAFSKASRTSSDLNLVTSPFRIRGKVIDSDDKIGIPGVSITVSNTSKGAITDVDGYFELTIDEPDVPLVIKFIGYIEETVYVTDSILTIELTPDLLALEEVVVVGYGSSDQQPLKTGYTAPYLKEGKKAFNRYLADHLKYPEQAIVAGIEGKVVLRFTITSSGRIGEIRVRKGLGYGCDEEAIRLLKEGPEWVPAKNNDRPIDAKATVKIKFTLP